MTGGANATGDVSAEAARLPAPEFAAITFDEQGGGVATASRLLWRVCQDTWGDQCRVVTLARPSSSGVEASVPGLLPRMKFGLGVLGRQAADDGGWLFFSHLALAKAQAFVPATLRRPYVIYLHGIEAWRVLGPRDRRVLSEAALVLANSQHTKQRLLALNPDVVPVHVCPLALPPDAAPSVGDRETVGTAAPVVLMVGRMVAAERYKGHDEVLNAWPAVIQRVPSARLVIVGEGDDRDRLEGKARALGVASSLTFTGFVSAEERQTWYDRAAVLAMPSRNEGFGLVYLEAMAHGVPCLGSVHDAAAEVIEDGVSGCLVLQSDERAISDRLTLLLSDGPRRAAMGRAGRERVQRLFTYEVFADRLRRLLVDQLGPRLVAARS